MHTSQLKPTAQLVVQVYNEILYLAQIQQALDCTWQKKQVTREHWVKMTEYVFHATSPIYIILKHTQNLSTDSDLK